MNIELYTLSGRLRGQVQHRDTALGSWRTSRTCPDESRGELDRIPEPNQADGAPTRFSDSSAGRFKKTESGQNLGG